MSTRRKFLQVLSTGAIGLIPAAADAQAGHFSVPSRDADQPAVLPVSEGWEFRLDPTASATPPEAGEWQSVQVPHTWQSLGRSPDYSGVAWYRLRFQAPASWAARHVRIEFEAVTHTAHVFLNGKPVGEHVGKGYTAFTLDLSHQLQPGQPNILVVRVDNRPNDRMLPRNKSYDWTDDGGIVRPVNLLITPRVYIERVEIDAVPDLDRHTAEVVIRAIVRNTAATPERVELGSAIRGERSGSDFVLLAPAAHEVPGNSDRMVEFTPVLLQSPSLWHFDSPSLYLASVAVKSTSGVHEMVETFGIRKFEVRGSAFYLNDEKVSLMGVERMAGSHPEMGMAEISEWIDSNHRDMKRLNCVFTRVHWAQDRRVLDFCDRHGILFQEEVPAWGPETFLHTTAEVQQALEQNGLEQLREMITRDRNHPCIVSWGLCNEVDGKNPRSRQFALALGAEARRLDSSRLQTYASHSLGSDPGADMAGDFDFISTNEYYGSWTPGGPADVEAHLDRIRKAFPNKPIVVSEYGWCECQPKIMPGDDNRQYIINSHTEVFRKFPEVAGAIYFDYNDYRTLVGDKGTGAMRQRVHGVVDLYGNAKPSFEALRLQASPVEHLSVQKTAKFQYEVEIRTRQQLPAYTLRGYSLRWIAYGYDGLPMAGAKMPLTELQPGSTQSFQVNLQLPEIRRVVIDVLRPTGFSTMTAEHLERDASR